MTPPSILFWKAVLTGYLFLITNRTCANRYEDRLAFSLRSIEEINCVKCQNAGQFSRILLEESSQKKKKKKKKERKKRQRENEHSVHYKSTS